VCAFSLRSGAAFRRLGRTLQIAQLRVTAAAVGHKEYEQRPDAFHIGSVNY